MREVISFRCLTIILALLLAVRFSGVQAQEATPTPAEPKDLVAFEIYPKGKLLGDFFEPAIDAGNSEDLVVVLANTGNVAFEGRTYATNAYSGENGGFAVAETGAAPEGVTTWLDYPEELYTIAPGKGIERTFRVAVPEGTEPGQYITALVLENAEALAVEGSENFEQLVRFAVPVFITVPGPIEPEFEVGEITLITEEINALIYVEIVNTGNVRVRPEGTVTVSDAGGEQLFNAPVSMGSVYARDSTSLVVGLPPLPFGKYQITVDLADPETGATATGEATVTATAPTTPAPPPPVQIFDASGTPRPDADDVQFLVVAAPIENAGEPLTNVQVTLRVTKDGESVEDFPLATSLGVPTGQTHIQERYIPVTGWEAGTWAFTLSVEAVNAGTGVAQVLATVELDELVIP
ncbi:MAG: hypothetical protein ACRDJH_07775 [Thermomicrobiales bacterium]